MVTDGFLLSSRDIFIYTVYRCVWPFTTETEKKHALKSTPIDNHCCTYIRSLFYNLNADTTFAITKSFGAENKENIIIWKSFPYIRATSTPEDGSLCRIYQ